MPLRALLSPSCVDAACDAFLVGELLGSSSSSIALKAAGVIIRCLFAPLVEVATTGCADFLVRSMAPSRSLLPENSCTFSFRLLIATKPELRTDIEFESGVSYFTSDFISTRNSKAAAL